MVATPFPHGIKTSLLPLHFDNLRGLSKSPALFFPLTLTSYIHYRCGGDGVALLPHYYFLSSKCKPPAHALQDLPNRVVSKFARNNRQGTVCSNMKLLTFIIFQGKREETSPSRVSLFLNTISS